SNASSILVGKEVGAGNLKIAYTRAWRLVYMCQLIIAMTCTMLVAFHKPILSIMGMKGESFRIAFGFVCIYGVAAIIRMGNWVQNDTYRSAGDAVYGTVLEIVFMWVMVIPLVWMSGRVWNLSTFIVFALCYVDEPIRYVLMQIHLFRGTWIKPVTKEGNQALEEFRQAMKEKKSIRKEIKG
ncbi:MAG: hypothetical protein J6Z22_08690, partial [Lachnospiraceae bacterium]|nr:hypothetical protein [Lachnospiraceae bacterium]